MSSWATLAVIQKLKFMSETATVHVSISGRVQGVGFRAWAHATARQLDLNGWVRNRRDGTIEAVFQGGSDQLSDMLQRCEHGPPAAHVNCVRLLGEVGEKYQEFELRPTS